MRPDNANAVGMILVLLSALILIIFMGKMRHKSTLGKRIAIALLAGFLILVFSSIGFGYKCPTSFFTTGNRGFWLSACGVAIGLFIPNRMIIVASCIAIIIAGFKLNIHYDYLVNRTGLYGYRGTNGYAYNLACPDEATPEVKLRPIWHSRLTEIYKVEK